VQADDFDLREGGGVALQGDARKAVVVAYQERKKDEITHPLLAQSLPWAWCRWCRRGCWHARCATNHALPAFVP
jgi:hypothetical protein